MCPFLLALREIFQLEGHQLARDPVSKAICQETRENAPGRLITFFLSRYFAQHDCVLKSVAYDEPAISRRVAPGSVVSRSV